MKNRLLLIGDHYCGHEGEAWQHLVDLLLCEYPEIPLQFHLHSTARNTLQALFQNCPRDIIGKQAGTILLCVGYQDLRAGGDPQQLCAAYDRLLHEIRSNSLAKVIPVTLHLPGVAGIQQLNAHLRAVSGESSVFDFAQICAVYQKKQAARGEFQRNLLDNQGVLAHLGQMLFARTLSQSLEMDCEHFSWDQGAL